VFDLGIFLAVLPILIIVVSIFADKVIIIVIVMKIVAVVVVVVVVVIIDEVCVVNFFIVFLLINLLLEFRLLFSFSAQLPDRQFFFQCVVDSDLGLTGRIITANPIII